MRGRGLLLLVAGLYALGILVPAAVLAGILFASLERERVASAEKRRLELLDACDAVTEAVEAEIARVRERSPVEPSVELAPVLRSLWGPEAPAHGLVRLVATDARGAPAIHPFERVIDSGPPPEDTLLIASREFRGAMFAEQRGDHEEAVGRLGLALSRTEDAREAAAIRLALARVRLAQRQPLQARDHLRKIDLTDAKLGPRLRLRLIYAYFDVSRMYPGPNHVNRAALRETATRLLETEAHRLGYFAWVDARKRLSPWPRKSLGQPRELHAAYQFLSANRARLVAVARGGALVWKDPPSNRGPCLVTGAAADDAGTGTALTFVALDSLLASAREGGLDLYLARRDLELTPWFAEGALDFEVKAIHRKIGIVDRAPVGESVWADSDSRLLLILAGLTLLGLLGGLGVTLWAVNKQARLARLRADFISSVSHELKTPLTSLLLFTDLLRTGRVTDPAKVSEYHDFMGEESAKLAHLVSNILDFARLEEGRKTYSFVPVEVGEVLRHTAAMFAARAEAVGARIECDGVPEGDLHLRADRDALERVLANLLDNAIKYGTKEGGAIELGAQRIGEEVRLTITDHGSGIPAAARRRVFTRFTRGDHHGPDAPPGSGLGLAIVAELVAAHDGRVAVADTEGGGTTVAVTLPRAAAPEQSPLQSGDPEEQA